MKKVNTSTLDDAVIDANATEADPYKSETLDTIDLVLKCAGPGIWGNLRCAAEAMRVLPWYEHQNVLQAVLRRKPGSEDF